MASDAVDIGHGLEIDFGTSGFTAQITDVTPPESSRAAIDTSHLGTSGGKTFMPADLVDNGELEIEFHFNPDTDPPIDQPAETITITWLGPDDAAGATWAFSGFMTNYRPGAMVSEEKMGGTAVVKVSGDITRTPDAV